MFIKINKINILFYSLAKWMHLQWLKSNYINITNYVIERSTKAWKYFLIADWLIMYLIVKTKAKLLCRTEKGQYRQVTWLNEDKEKGHQVLTDNFLNLMNLKKSMLVWRRKKERASFHFNSIVRDWKVLFRVISIRNQLTLLVN